MGVDTSPENLYRRIVEAGAEDRVTRSVRTADGSLKSMRTVDAIAERLSGASVDDDPADPRLAP